MSKKKTKKGSKTKPTADAAPSKGTQKGTSSGIKIVCDNRKARHNYFLGDKFEAGMVLLGTEVKSLRDGKANLVDAYAVFRGHELFLLHAHIAEYSHGNQQNHEPLRTRKLLLRKSELHKLWIQREIKKMSLIPTKLYFKRGTAKVEIALAKGKKAHDKRESTKEREVQRDMDRIKRQYR